MADVNRNRINSYLYCYSIENNKESFNKLAQVITKRKFFAYQNFFYLIDNYRIVCEDSNSIIIEIDLNQHNALLEDVTKCFFTKKLGTQKVEEKKNQAYMVENLFLTLKV